MTTNQIKLREVVEMERHNRAVEQEDVRHNTSTERYTEEHYVRSDTAALQQAYAATSQAETARGNMAINAVNAETQRYTAETQRMSYQEGARHNLVVETETQRHNVATENEAVRHNVASEAVERTKAAASTMQAEAAKTQAVSYAVLVGEQVVDMVQSNVGEAKERDARINKLNAEAEAARKNAESNAINANANNSNASTNYLNYTLNRRKADRDDYLANLEGLKYKDKYYESKDTGTGLTTFFRRAVDIITN